MSFIINNEENLHSVIKKVDENEKLRMVTNKEIKLITKAHGFDPEGFYKFESNIDKKRDPNSPDVIYGGQVVGTFVFEIGNQDCVRLLREDFDDKAWKSICAAFGFKYNNIHDLNRFTIFKDRVDVGVCIDTPNYND